MTRIIGVLNFKGGTGKTTTAVNVAAGLARVGKRVLCIDLDAQGSVAAYFGTKFNYTLYHLFLWDVPAQQCILKVRPNLDIIPSNSANLDIQGYLWRLNDNDAARLAVGKRLASLTDYDFIFLDSSPSASILSESAMLYIRELIVPVQMSHMSIVGFVQVTKTLREIGRIPEHQVHLSCIVPTFYDGRRIKDREIYASLQKRFPHHVTDPIRANVKLAEAPSHHKTIFEYAPYSYGAKDYGKLVDRLLASESSE